MKIFDANISGSLNVSGSANFLGDLTVGGTINATISGTTSNALTLNTTGSARFATTGSNTFNANQTISGSLYVTTDIILNGQSYTGQTSGTSGTSGSNGTNGSSGTSGSNGTNGSSGTSGSNGTNGSSGTSGSNGTNGSSGTSGSNGTNGTSGSNGTNGTSGSNGTNGSSGSSGSNGTNGSSGTSVTVSGTDGVLGKFSSNSMVNSNVSDNGSVVKINSDTTITGSLTVTQNLNVLGSASITYTTASQLRVNDNVITVNASSPGVRFAGLSVIDSGSSPTVSGSFLFDSLNNQFVYVHTNQSTVTSSVVLVGAQTYNSLGNETLPTQNRIIKSLGQEHLGDSNISDNGTTIRNLTNTEVTGSLIVTAGITGALTGNASTATTLQTARNIQGVSFNGSADITVITAGVGVGVSGTQVSIGQAVGSGANVQFASLGVGTAAPITTGLIRASNDVIAYYGSDSRLKENVVKIANPLEKLSQINGYEYDWIPMEGIHENEGHDIGVIAQEIEIVLPELVTTRENGYKAVKYDKLVALLIETNKELLNRIEDLEAKIK